MNDNDRNDTYINDNSHNKDVSSGIGLLNSHTLPQDNESSNLNETNMRVDNGDVNGDYCYMNIYTGYESKNSNSIDYTNKRDKISTQKIFKGNNGLPDGVVIYDMLPASALNQYVKF